MRGLLKRPNSIESSRWGDDDVARYFASLDDGCEWR